MKTKIFLTAVMLVFCSVILNAQQDERKTSVAITLQPNVVWIKVDASDLSKGPVRLGFEGGLRVDRKLEKFCALSFGINLNQTGGNINYKDEVIIERETGLDTLQAGTRITYRLQYFEIPVAIKFLLPEMGYYTGFAEVGIDPMINIRAHINATDNNIENENFKKGVAMVNMGWHAGLGFNYAIGNNMALRFAVVYKNTFLDVTKENDIRKPDQARINQVGLNMGIVF